MNLSLLEWFELLSYVVTVFGFPFAILLFILERRKERQNDEEETYQRLSDEYTNFLKLVLENADLHILKETRGKAELTEEQSERKLALFGILISLFERAYLLVYEEDMSSKTSRLWASWEDYMGEWCSRDDFRTVLPELLQGEDEDFSAHIKRIANEYSAHSKSPR